MTDLVEFLNARITEDEHVAQTITFEREWSAHPDETGQPIKAGKSRIATCAESVMTHIARHDPARVLAECDAKRRILDRLDELATGAADYGYFGLRVDGHLFSPGNDAEQAAWALAMLALPYARRPRRLPAGMATVMIDQRPGA